MLTSSRPSKRVQEQLHPKPMVDGFFTESSLEEVCDSLHVDIHNALRSSINESRTFLDGLPCAENLDDKVLRINVGGSSFLLLPETILRQAPESLLGQMVFLSHEQRLSICTGYLAESREYFFERSPDMFCPIYTFFVCGIMHKKSNVCLDVFMQELAFWNIRKAVFAACATNKFSTAKMVTYEKPNEFKGLRLGSIREQIWNFIEVPESSVAARWFACFSLLAVLLATMIMVVASIPEFQIKRNITELGDSGKIRRVIEVSDPHPTLKYSEYACMVWFTLEYLTKIAVAANRRRAFFQLLSLIDLIAIIPFYLELGLEITGIELRQLEELNGAFLMMRVLRVSRVIRIFKLGRYSSGLRAFARTLSASKKQLSMLGVVLTTGVMFFSTLVYNLEKDAPDTKFKSIPESFWWCIVTMTTVGYGDMYPTTTLGKLVGSGAIACGVLVLALPITIIVDNFMEVHDDAAQCEHDVSVGGGIAALMHGLKGYGLLRHKSMAAKGRLTNSSLDAQERESGGNSEQAKVSSRESSGLQIV